MNPLILLEIPRRRCNSKGPISFGIIAVAVALALGPARTCADVLTVYATNTSGCFLGTHVDAYVNGQLVQNGSFFVNPFSEQSPFGVNGQSGNPTLHWEIYFDGVPWLFGDFNPPFPHTIVKGLVFGNDCNNVTNIEGKASGPSGNGHGGPWPEEGPGQPPGEPPQTPEGPNNPCGGMPVWSVSEPYIDLWLNDEPLGYTPALGPRISFTLAYKQREESAGADTNIFSAGQKWNFSWLSYVTLDLNGSNMLVLPGGKQRMS